MTRVNVVTVNSGWILQKIAERLVEAGNEGGHGDFILSHFARNDVDANYYVDIQNCYMGKTRGLDIGFFTHLHENDPKHIQEHWKTLDHVTHMCAKYLRLFEDEGIYPIEKMSVLYPGEIPEHFDLKKPILGIFQRGKYEGKGFFFLKDFVNKELETAKKFHWRFVGSGWQEIIDLMTASGVLAHGVDDSNIEYPIGYSTIYNNTDAVLIPSLWEGGPMSIIEASAKGLPIISGNIGWSKDLGVDHMFTTGSTHSLKNALEEYISVMEKRRKRVDFLSYHIFASKLVEIVEDLKA
jgi:glycosyltransferase involved in cell wall biosynthesis